jgi:hypothetical protein
MVHEMDLYQGSKLNEGISRPRITERKSGKFPKNGLDGFLYPNYEELLFQPIRKGPLERILKLKQELLKG